jgi:hypothetical protein
LIFKIAECDDWRAPSHSAQLLDFSAQIAPATNLLTLLPRFE